MATKEQVWAAADAISASGANPTLAAVRAYMGGGSYTDISAGMQGWRAAQAASREPIREPVPAAISERLGELGAEVWSTALALANARLQSEREALEVARQEAEDTRKEAAALADTLALELDKVQAENVVLSEQLAVSVAKLQEQQSVVERETTIAIESKHRAELAEVVREELKNRVDQLSELLNVEQIAHLATRTALEQSQQEKAKLDGMIEVFNAIGGTATQTVIKPSVSNKPKPRGKAKSDG